MLNKMSRIEKEESNKIEFDLPKEVRYDKIRISEISFREINKASKKEVF